MKIRTHTGSFAENKDIAQSIRLTYIMPTLQEGKDVVLDFEGVDSATQSFIHALLADVLRTYGDELFDVVYFKNCNEIIRKLIELVIAYMQESS